METQKMEKWGTKLTIKFLKKYREHRCLWDFNDTEYKNRVARTKALEDIVASMALNNFDVRSANVKIKALRSTYLHEKRKIRKSTKTGITYRPKLAWYPLADSFLRNYVMEKFCLMGAVPNDDDGQQSAQPKEPTKLNDENISNDQGKQNFTNSLQTPISNATQQKTQNSSVSRFKQPTQLQQQLQQTLFTNSQPNVVAQSSSDKRDKLIQTSNQIQTSLTTFGGIIDNCRGNPSFSNSILTNHQKEYDEFDAFANSVVAQMRTLPLDIAYEIQLQIQCLITQTKLKVLGRQTSIIVESNNNNNNSNNNNNNPNTSRNWNHVQQHNGNFSNPCNGEVKIEEDDDAGQQTNNTMENNQNNPMPNTNCYTSIPDGLQDAEASDVEDYLGLE